MINDLEFDLFNVINKVQVDKYRRVSAFLGMNKPKGITSHDLVDQVRKKLQTRAVGHVGALDPNAEGVMLILVGKKYTRLSDTLMKLDKTYRMKILFGISTTTLDVEGQIKETSDISNFDFNLLNDKIKEFEGGYNQSVPVYSSVKVQGNKLRVLARKYSNYEIFAEEGIKYVKFTGSEGEKDIVLPLPIKKIELKNIRVIDSGYETVARLKDIMEKNDFTNDRYPFIEIETDCSKGTYVRQFAYDLAKSVGQVGMLIDLKRTRLGSTRIEDSIKIEDLEVPNLI